MPNNEMDYSLIHRTPDGNGKILVTTPGSPDKGSWETEAELKTYVNQDVNTAINALNTRVTNIEETLMGENEITVQYPDDGNYSSLMPNKVPLRALKFAEVPRFRGKSRAWNQLCPIDILGSKTVSDVTITNNGDGSYTLNGTASSNIAEYLTSAINLPIGHKILFGYVNINTAITGLLMRDQYSYAATETITIWQCSASTSAFSVIIANGTALNNVKIVPIIRDLTLIFGAGNEPSTVADALAQLPALGQYNAYDAGSLVDTVVSGAKSVGKNLAQINNFTQSVSYGTEVPCVLKGGLTYTASGTVGGGSTLRFLKSDGTYQYIGLNENFDETFVAEGDITEATFFGEVTVSNFQVELGSSKTSFAPWVNPDTLSLPETVTLRSAGSVADELDVESGVVTRKVKTLKIKDFAWEDRHSFDGNLVFYANVTDSHSGYCHAVCGKFLWVTKNATELGNHEFDMSSNQTYLYLKADECSSIAELVQTFGEEPLTYELETPTTESIDPVPYNFLEVEGGGTVDTIQTQTPIIDNSLDVTYDIIPQ